MAKLQLMIGEKTCSIEAGAHQSLLDHALSRAIPISYSCKRGDCGQCLGTLLSGNIEPMDPARPLFRDDKIYLCNALALGDVAIQLPYVPELNGIQTLRSACKIHELTRLSNDVLQVSFRLPPATLFDFVPGQYIRLTNKHRVTRSYSLAYPPHSDKLLHIHVRRVADGIFSRYLFETARPGDLLHIEGPMGQFILRSDTKVRKTLFLATGTGIAPIHAMISSMSLEQRACCGEIYAYWGNYRPTDVYFSATMLALAYRNGVRYFEVFSREEDVQTTRRVRHVQELLAKHHSDLADAQVFASGNPAMIDDGRRQAIDLNLPASRFFADAFTSS